MLKDEIADTISHVGTRIALREVSASTTAPIKRRPALLINRIDDTKRRVGLSHDGNEEPDLVKARIVDRVALIPHIDVDLIEQPFSDVLDIHHWSDGAVIGPKSVLSHPVGDTSDRHAGIRSDQAAILGN